MAERTNRTIAHLLVVRSRRDARGGDYFRHRISRSNALAQCSSQHVHEREHVSELSAVLGPFRTGACAARYHELIPTLGLHWWHKKLQLLEMDKFELPTVSGAT